MDSFEPGLVVAGYRLDRLLGQGGMGVVFEATQLSLDRTVALKIVAPQLSSDIAFRARFRRECLIQARMEHPNIVTVHEAGEFQDTLFLAMRLVRGSSLKDMITAGELDTERTLRILASIADALDSAHEANLIHRDVKPHNILVGARDHPYLADFGLTKRIEDTGLTRTGQFVGSLDYISPEQIQSEPATRASDIYALGAVLFECLTGVVPYLKESEAAVLYAHVAQAPPRVTDHRPTLPVALNPVLERAMAKEPTERHATATELISEAKRASRAPTSQAMQESQTVKAPVELGIHPPGGDVDTPAEQGIRPPDGDVDTLASADKQSEHLAVEELREQPEGEPTVSAARSDEESTPTHVAETTSSATSDSEETLATKRGESTGASTLDSRWLAETVGAEPVVAPRTPAPTPTPARPARPARPRRYPMVLALGATVAVLVGSGFAIGHSGTRSSAVPTRGQQAGHVMLTVPASWERPAKPPSMPGLSFTMELPLKEHASGGVMLAGVIPGSGGKYLLPPAFLARLHGTLSANDAVKLAGGAAYRHRELTVPGLAGPLTLFVMPSTAGVVGVGCVPPPAGHSAFLASCEQAAGTLRLNRAGALPLGPLPGYGRVLAKSVAGLQGAQSTAESLAAARTRAGQASLSGSLARAHATAASMLSSATPGPDAATLNAGLVSGLRAAANGYRAMSRAASAGQANNYAAARTNTEQALVGVRNELAGLRAIGYGGQ